MVSPVGVEPTATGFRKSVCTIHYTLETVKLLTKNGAAGGSRTHKRRCPITVVISLQFRRLCRYHCIIFGINTFSLLFIGVDSIPMKCIKCQTETSNPRFCSRSCATSWNNKATPKRILTNKYCKICKKLLVRTSHCDRNVVCRECNPQIVDWSKITYGKMKCKQTYQRNSRIRSLARQLYRRSNKPKQCAVCHYDKHYEVCHNPPISSYSTDTPVSVINDLNHLVALCRNHHWEYDNGYLKLPS